MTGKIFLSYRREDTWGVAGRLFDRLEQSFPAGSLFMDVEGGIKAGQDFARVLEQEVSACDVMLVLIGPNWLTVADEEGRRRLENLEDFVRIEVESALRFGKHVIPVLVHKTEMPRADTLPEPLKALARRNAVGLTQERFKADAQGLIKALEGALAEMDEARRQAKTKAAAAEKRRAAEEAAKAEEAVRAEKERARLEAIAGLSPEQIAKAEELANWDFIKASESSQEFRDHLARFPQGVTERMARARLEGLVWTGLPRPADMDTLKGFLAEFPNGAHANEANAKLAELEAAEREKQERDAWASAVAAGTVAAMENFRRDWPQSKCAETARVLVETKLIRTFTGRVSKVRSVAFSPDGRSALSGSLQQGRNDDTLKLWDVATGKELRTFLGQDSTVDSVAFSPDGRNALSGGDTIKLWDVATGKELRTFVVHTRGFLSVAFSPDGRNALSGGDRLRLWDVARGREVCDFAGHTSYVRSVAFSPDGRSALSGGDDKTLRLWDVATEKEVRVFTGHDDRVRSVAFSPDGRGALSGSEDGTVRLWDIASGKEIHNLTGHTRQVYSVAFSPDGRNALSGSGDETLKLWDVATGKEVHRTSIGHAGTPTGVVASVVFSPDGRSALSGGDGLKLWHLTRR